MGTGKISVNPDEILEGVLNLAMDSQTIQGGEVILHVKGKG